MMKNICIYLILFISFTTICKAQVVEEKDSIIQKEWQFTSVLELADTAW